MDIDWFDSKVQAVAAEALPGRLVVLAMSGADVSVVVSAVEEENEPPIAIVSSLDSQTRASSASKRISEKRNVHRQ